MDTLYVLYLLGLAVLVGTIAITPLLALHGPKELAALSYNLYAPTCHQWIFRSSCVFYDGTEHRVGDCITGDKARITTEFTAARKDWDGAFEYGRDQIGRNRAEKVEYGDAVGYKFPNDTRNIGVYLSMLLSGLVLPSIWKRPEVPHVAFLVLAILPLAVDGTGQFLEFWESTNPVRFATGTLAGAAASAYVYAMLNRVK
ncbi:MAG: DUF2085 domain-containing protein [Candidatus Micrarchaeota archaeon]